jgi:serine/threonine-protein kinase RsbT
LSTPTRLAAHEIRIPINSDLDILAARQKGRELAKDLGFAATDLTIVATAISELARNIVLYTGGGEIILRSTPENDPSGVLIMAVDEGPGIADVADAMRGGYSTSGGLGLGLPGVRRLVDDFDIVSELGRGTTVTATRWRR